MPLNEDHIKELQGFVGLDPEKYDSPEDFKKDFEKKFVPVNALAEHEEVKKIYGKRIGEAETKLKQFAKGLGVEFADGELKDKKLEDVLELSQSKLKDKMKELQDSAGSTDDKKLQKIQDDLNKLQLKYDEELEAKNALKTEYEGFKTTVDEEKKTFKLNHKYDSTKNELKLRSDLRPVEKLGFDQHINSKYDRTISEDGELVFTDKNGKRIVNPKKAGEFLSAKEILEQEAQEQGLLAINDHGGKPAGNLNGGGKAPVKGEPTPEPKRKLAPRHEPRTA